MSASRQPPPVYVGGTGLAVPAIPRRRQRAPFPLVASAAPVVAACAIWAITQSPFVLLFAALGPIVALAGVLDGKRHNAATMRRESARFVAELAVLSDELDARHRDEREEAWRQTPTAQTIVEQDDDPGRWQSSGPCTLCLGSGSVPSAVRFESRLPEAERDGEDAAGAAALRTLLALAERAGIVSNAPVTAALSGGIAVVGPSTLAIAAMRGLLLQTVRALHPGSVLLTVPQGEEWRWAAALPHCAAAGAARTPSRIRLLDRTGGDGDDVDTVAASPESAEAVPEAVLVVAESAERLPPGCATILRVDSAHAALLVRAADGATGTALVPELLGRQQAALAAERLLRAAETAGLLGGAARVPDHVSLHDVPGFARHGSGLSCVLGVAANGPIVLDLVAHGPHALVGGTTGSGKSELLISWVVALAAAYTPEECTLLLVDFKGGAAFSNLASLPHCVGLLTDLDEVEAARALASLQAELRHRERTLRSVRARDIDDEVMRGRLPRLVIVVDEFAAMLGSAPDLHAVFVDIAARGRSLGMHLVLCTQRPAGIVRDALLANCNLRLSLRVNNRADSRATIGTDAAALLPLGRPGRAVVDAGDGRLIEFQSAVSRVDDLDRARGIDEATGPNGSARRPWLPPLPGSLRLGELEAMLALDPTQHDGRSAVETGADGRGMARSGEGTRFVLGLVDDPGQQRQSRAVWEPGEQGPLLVLGVARSGRSTVLAAIAEQAQAAAVPVQLCGSSEPEAYWDALVSAADPAADPAGGNIAGADRRSEPRVILFDDWDAVFARWPIEYQGAASELLGLALRDGQRRGLIIAVAASVLGGAVQTQSALFGVRLLLRQAEKSEHLRAGGRSGGWRASAPAGRGEWLGFEMQSAAPNSSAPLSPGWPRRQQVDPLLPVDDGIVLIVSTMPTRALAIARERATSAGQPDAVQELGAVERMPGARPVGPLVIVGDPDAWQARWGLFAELRPHATIAFHECRLSDYRTLSRQRELPPLLTRGGEARVIAVDRDGRVRRARLA
ncbi:FtsK/SpoIIIE domain-containing protein [Microterricola gilva]|nr:FtsK/SpoIIIE domain-containing protein [Microterricola gilva]